MTMKRFHISIAVSDFAASVADYSERLGVAPCALKDGRYALWKTDLLNFSISCKPGEAAGRVRHIGFEDASETGFREEQDANGITWEYFTSEAQAEEIEEKFGIVTPAQFLIDLRVGGGLKPQAGAEQSALDPRMKRG